MRKHGVRLGFCLALLAVAAVPAAAQDLLALARAQYHSAEYETALATLGSTPGGDPVEADRLRARCLLALGRSEEAEAVIARAVVAQPGYDVSTESPRVRGVYLSVRDRVLPDRGRHLYESGKAAFARRAFDKALATFEEALPILETLALEGRMDMEAMRILASDFVLLSRQQLPRPQEPLPPIAARGPVVEAFLPAPPAATDAVSEPVAIRQDLPPWTYGLGGPETTFRGAVDVQIDADGRVTEAVITQSVHPLYDPQLLLAARRWQYEPARLYGRAVSATKRVEVVLHSR